VGRVFQVDLPSIVISRLRAIGVITAETTEFVVKLGGVEQTVGVKARRFPNSGGWSSFLAPCCGKQVRILRLLDGALVCSGCCKRRGIHPRAETLSVRQRAEHRIPKLKAVLERDKPLRLKPSTLWGTMERRKRYEAALREAEFRVARAGSPRKTKAIIDPCEEPDFKPPRRPWPRLKSKLSEPG
jgi:hypothetical protein